MEACWPGWDGTRTGQHAVVVFLKQKNKNKNKNKKNEMEDSR